MNREIPKYIPPITGSSNIDRSNDDIRRTLNSLAVKVEELSARVAALEQKK